MLGIVKNKNSYDDSLFLWHESLFLSFLEISSLGYLTMENGKIVKEKTPWIPFLLYLGTDLIVVLSLGYFCTNWIARYYARDF